MTMCIFCTETGKAVTNHTNRRFVVCLNTSVTLVTKFYYELQKQIQCGIKIQI